MLEALEAVVMLSSIKLLYHIKNLRKMLSDHFTKTFFYLLTTKGINTMRKTFTFLGLWIWCLNTTFAQVEALEAIFEKEEPAFQVSILPIGEEGVIELEVYFTHSRVNNLEASFWMIDRGESRLGNGTKQLIGALQPLNNRQQTVVRIEGLKVGHYYGFGLDYRKKGTLGNSKFATKLLQDGYQYEAPKLHQVVPAPADYVEKKASNLPCESPNITVKVAATGYCENNQNPAILIQNKTEQNWEFLIETRNSKGDWRPLWSGGKRQSATGLLVRTEPLCLLSTGTYYVRVLAWGENCTKPVVKEIAEPVTVQDGITPPDTQIKYALPYIAENTLPDTCIVLGTATLEGNVLMGQIELDRLSPCGDWSPFATVKYVHPGHRDISLDPMPLTAGESVHFQIQLDNRDLTRSVHPINVMTFIAERNAPEGKLMSAFWMRANEPSTTAVAQTKTNNSGTNQRVTNTTDRSSAATFGNNPTQEVQAEKGVQSYEQTEERSREMEAVNIVASDPNCTQINDLQLVYDIYQSTKPLYLEWLSPRCCQEGGCEYTIWSGVAPNQLKLFIKGFKSGTYIRELIDPANVNDKYFEIVVKTPNGTRKAAYGVGKGAMYGIESILAYHDTFTPQQSDTIAVSVPITPSVQELPTASKTVFAWDEPTTTTVNNNTPFISYQKPTMSIHKFVPCQTQDQMRIQGDTPVQVGDVVTIDYPFEREGYKYTLYFQPVGKRDWFIAPDTEELYDITSFTFKVGKHHAGNYVMLLYKSEKNWGCLSKSPTQPLVLEVID